MKTNSVVYPVEIFGTKHFFLSVEGMLTLANAVAPTDPELAKQLREAAGSKVEEARAKMASRKAPDLG